MPIADELRTIRSREVIGRQRYVWDALTEQRAIKTEDTIAVSPHHI
jgi:hypothetical protein